MTTNDTTPEQLASDSDWRPCVSGEIGGMVRHIQRGRRKTFALQLTSAAAAGILAGFLFIHFHADNPAETIFAGISCQKVREHARRYVAGSLPADLHKQITAHLAECPHCPKFIREMKHQSESNGSSIAPSTRTTTVSKERSRRTLVGIRRSQSLDTRLALSD